MQIRYLYDFILLCHKKYLKFEKGFHFIVFFCMKVFVFIKKEKCKLLLLYHINP